MTLKQLVKIIFSLKKEINTENNMKTFLIAGLGNIGEKYANTRHNIGFKILDELASKENVSFETEKLGYISKFRIK